MDPRARFSGGDKQRVSETDNSIDLVRVVFTNHHHQTTVKLSSAKNTTLPMESLTKLLISATGKVGMYNFHTKKRAQATHPSLLHFP